ncbi:cucumisin-like [Phalaenopsis equestris]|uniref:cucumisin-like n=1 Tax=Phalaenopsis equestris TaxID=78828 RepID=UPI0009E1D038|nr:cucumisin-like [Phalaenopsis equestris]
MACNFVPRYFLLFSVALILMTNLIAHANTTQLDKKAYIIYMGELENRVSVQSLHENLLGQVITSDLALERLIHSFGKSFNGFAAMLSDEEADILSDMDEVVSVFPSQKRKLHTTRSWSFMGFPSSSPRGPFESDVIVGMLDTGIWPESESLNDAGFGQPPSKWAGTCDSNHNFTCNNKIIGARFYHLEGNISKGNSPSPRDTEGHGSHTSSTVAGRLVADASLSGLAEGTARGGVPSARLAVYKVCWDGEGCSDVDILAAFDDAIADGVDIISISIGGSYPNNYFSNSIAIGSFHAMKKGILVSSSAGNDGPGRFSLENFAPWMISVAASTIDRKFVVQVKLGNGQVYKGKAINTYGNNGTMYPLIYAANAPNTTAGFSQSSSRYCGEGTLDSKLPKGKVLICDGISDGKGAKLAGAMGAIMATNDMNDAAYEFQLPVSVLGSNDTAKILLYANMTEDPVASISSSEEAFDGAAPYVISFSSRGPNPITPNLLKPDLAAPGVDILAAWSPLNKNKPGVPYNIISGTSMACPHVSGAAAYIKSFNPTWSPAAIRSALMTTAYAMSSTKNTDAEFAYGSGHLNPLAALNPGLVYDIEEIDYIKFLCGLGYTTKNLSRITGDSSSCTSKINGTVFDLNYPSFALSITKGKPFSATYHRTVTNAGGTNSTYEASVISGSGLKVNVEPSILSFQNFWEKKSFVVKLEGETNKTMISAALVWSDGVHKVRSPIVVFNISPNK